MNVVAVAPEIAEQPARLAPAVFEVGHAYQARALMVGVGLPVNIPPGSVAVTTCPTYELALMVGAFATTGAPRVATAVLAVELVPLPIAFTARTTTW